MTLAKYLSRNRISPTAFAETIGVSQAAVSRYACGKRIPRGPIMARIVAATKGKVTANDFMPAIPQAEATPEGVAA